MKKDLYLVRVHAGRYCSGQPAGKTDESFVSKSNIISSAPALTHCVTRPLAMISDLAEPSELHFLKSPGL